MYWSAAMSLKTTPSRDKPNYGSIRSTPRSINNNSYFANSCSGSVRIPQSIPEHQCVLQFASPRQHHFEEHKLAEYYELEQYAAAAAAAQAQTKAKSTTTTTVTVTASKALQYLLLASRKLDAYSSAASTTDSNNSSSTSSSDDESPTTSAFAYTRIDDKDEHAGAKAHDARLASLNGSFASKAAAEMVAAAAQAANDDRDGSNARNYWMLERERRRVKAERRHLLAQHAAASTAADDEPAPAWRTATIMCSVPLLLVVLFVAYVLLSGGGSASSNSASGSESNASVWDAIVRTVFGAVSSSSDSDDTRRMAALRGAA